MTDGTFRCADFFEIDRQRYCSKYLALSLKFYEFFPFTFALVFKKADLNFGVYGAFYFLSLADLEAILKI